jgi:probable rRNA maturation factor
MPSPQLQISVATSGRGWTTAWKGREAGAKAIIRAALPEREKFPAIVGQVEVEFSSDAAVRALNKTFRGKDKPTNVLSFPNPRAPFGSIILAYETIKAEAQAQDKTLIRHAKHLILHGFLHLLGYDHETVTDRRLMERLEIRILAHMGIPNPYLSSK